MNGGVSVSQLLGVHLTLRILASSQDSVNLFGRRKLKPNQYRDFGMI